MEQKDFYRILGVDNKASQRNIRAAYRNLAFQFHPDRNRDNPAAATRMKEINEAYAILSDPKKRSEYDALRQAYGSSAYAHFRQSYSQEDIFRGSDIQQIFEQVSRMFGFRGFDEVFREFYGPGYQSFEFRRPGVFGKGFVFTSSSARATGGIPNFPVSGKLGKFMQHALRKAWGIEWPEKGKDQFDQITINPQLALTGGKVRYLYRSRSKELIVRIPPAIRDGQRIRLKGMGENGKGGGGPGDLYIKVRVKKSLLAKVTDFVKGHLTKG